MNLYNADCLDIMREMPDKSVDLVITDPPYGIGEDGGRCRTRGSDHTNGDCLEWDDKTPSKEYFDEMFRVSKNQIIFGGNYFELPISRGWIYWQKDMGGDFGDGELAWTSFDRVLKQFRKRSETFNRFHPTQKPVKLFEWIIRNYAKEGDVICDPFFGSGACLVAAVRLGHPIIGVEKEKVYFDKAKARIENAQRQGKLSSWGMVLA